MTIGTSLIGFFIIVVIGLAIWALAKPPLYNPLIAVAVLLLGIIEAITRFGGVH